KLLQSGARVEAVECLAVPRTRYALLPQQHRLQFVPLDLSQSVPGNPIDDQQLIDFRAEFRIAADRHDKFRRVALAFLRNDSDPYPVDAAGSLDPANPGVLDAGIFQQ